MMYCLRDTQCFSIDMFVGSAEERFATQHRISRPMNQNAVNTTVSNIPQAISASSRETRPTPRASMSTHAYQANKRASGPNHATNSAPTPSAYPVIKEPSEQFIRLLPLKCLAATMIPCCLISQMQSVETESTIYRPQQTYRSRIS